MSLALLLEAVAIAGVLGLFAGMAPGPYTTMVVATALERGFRAAVPLAFAPLLTDLVPLAATAWLLASLSDTAVAVMSVVGGLVVTAIGIRLLVRYGPPAPEEGGPRSAPTIRFWHVVSSTLLSPAPWLFWLGVASPLLLRRWAVDWRLGTAFAVTLFAVNIGSATSLAWAASHGRRVLAPYWRHRLLRVMAAALLLAGLFLVWQGLAGRSLSMDPAVVEDFLPGDGGPP